MMQLIIGLKIDAYHSFSECVKIIRQFKKCSIQDMKTAIDNHDYILCFACTDEAGIKTIIMCYDHLVAAGITVSLYELDHRQTTIENIRNRNRLYDEIAAEIDSDDE